jgi:hypothetical protein
MTHLTELELVDSLEGRLVPSRMQHLAGCETCRHSVSDLRDVLTRTAELDVPEPSPLFWEHFSARVRTSVEETEPDSPTWPLWTERPGIRWAMAAAFVMTLGAGAWLATWRTASPGVQPIAEGPRVVSTTSTPAVEIADEVVDVESDEAWALVRAVADDVSWDAAEAEGMGARPGSAERALLTLTVEERSELLRLLQIETKRTGA